MLNFESNDNDTIVVSAISPDDQILLEEESESRILGEIIRNDSDEYEFVSSPTQYFHALWWVTEDDFEELKSKISELNA